MYARRVTLIGPAENMTDAQVRTAAGFFDHFARNPGHLGGHLLVDREKGCFCATSFWESTEAMDETFKSAESAARRMTQVIWGAAGSFEIEVFEVIGLKPAEAEVAIPEVP